MNTYSQGLSAMTDLICFPDCSCDLKWRDIQEITSEIGRSQHSNHLLMIRTGLCCAESVSVPSKLVCSFPPYFAQFDA